MDFTIGTLNILHPAFAEKHHTKEGLGQNGKSNWHIRKDKIAALISRSNLDVICLQEISHQSNLDLQEKLKKEYEIAHIPRSRGDGLAIYFKNVRFEKMNFTDLADGLCFIDLKDRTTGKAVRVANCHLQGGNQQHRGKKQIETLLAEVTTPISVIAGDFNADESQLRQADSKFSALLKAGFQHDGNLDETEVPKPNSTKGRHIDWIWCRGLAPQHHEIAQNEVVSDHLLSASSIPLGKIAKATPQPNDQSIFSRFLGSLMACFMLFLSFLCCLKSR